MAHALLSPSAAHRWLNCTPSARLEERMPESTSSFAEEGTLAHAYCAKALKEFLGQSAADEEKEIASLYDDFYSGEMDEYVETYKTIVLEKYNAARAKTPDAQLLVEVRLTFQDFMPDAFGTADAVIIADGVMEIIDFKYGKGVKVSAVENPQMKIYALGAFAEFSIEYNIHHVRMTIVQPRIDNLSEFEMDVPTLLAWAKYQLRPAAIEAYRGKGAQKAGDWCKFCKVRATCKALADLTFAAVRTHSEPSTISPEDMAETVLPMLDTVKTWLKAVEEYSLEQALSGVKFPGYKLVAGRSIRKIVDPEAVMETLASEFAEEAYMKPRELKTITDLEKVIGKKRFTALCGEYIDKPQGKPTLVPESDKREALNTDSFGGVELTD